MLFLDYFTFAALVLFSVVGICRGLHVVGQAYLTARLVQNAKRHQDWLEFTRCHR